MRAPVSPTGVTSGMVGREADLAECRSALERVVEGSAQVLLIGGDAGLGKTTLVTALAESAAARGVRVLVGHCLDVDSGAGLSPVLDAVRPLVRDSAHDGSYDERPALRRAAAVYDADHPGGGLSAHTLDDLRQCLLEVAGGEPVVLVLEDMHWSDRSTQDFAVALARTLTGRLMLVLTYRTDDLTRRHPFRRAAADIALSSGVRRVDLTPLDREGVAALVTRHTEQPADPSLVGSVLARSEGNPLFAKEILTAPAGTVPSPLAELLLARVEGLAEPAQRLLRIAAVAGTRIDASAVADVMGVAPADVDALLRHALDANVVTIDGDQVAFRHGLIREAVYDDLLPGERARIHGQYAGALESRTSSASVGAPAYFTTAEIAFHWYAAHELPAAFAASVRAGLEAVHHGAAEARGFLERAVELWDRVPDAEAVGGVAQPELLRLLAEVITQQGDKDRSSALIREAVALLDPLADPLMASRVYTTLVMNCMDVGDLIGHEEAAQRAVRLADGPPSRELAAALRGSAIQAGRRHQYAEQSAYARRAVDVARAADCDDEVPPALEWLADALFLTGAIAAGDACSREAIDVARRAGNVHEELKQEALFAFWISLNHDKDSSLAMARDARSRALGAGVFEGAWEAGFTEAGCYLFDGRFDECAMTLTELREFGMPSWYWVDAWVELLVARGDTEAALPYVKESDDLWARLVEDPKEWTVRWRIDLALQQGDAARAAQHAREFLTCFDDTDSALRLAQAARCGYLALNQPALRGAPADLATLSERALDRARAGLTPEWEPTVYGVALHVADGLQARLRGGTDVPSWRSALTAARPIGRYIAHEPLVGLAEALLVSGERDEGRDRLLEAWDSARFLGSPYVLDPVATLGRRHRIPLPGAGEAAGPLARLTEREREILDLIATGATNRAIAERLFISEKTVSAHITRLLAKLGCSNRGEAAALTRT